LPILATLECVLVNAGHALIAANPALGAGVDLTEQTAVTAHTWTADAIITQATVLRGSLARYRQLLRLHQQRLRDTTRDNDF
jgi:hypothetical protein